MHINLVTFGPVTSEFMGIKFVQQASISTRVSLTVFASGQH